MRVVDPLNEDIRPKRQPFILTRRRVAGDLGLLFGHKLRQRPSGQAACHFTPLVAADTVRHDVEPDLGCQPISVLVVNAPASVGCRRLVSSKHDPFSRTQNRSARVHNLQRSELPETA